MKIVQPRFTDPKVVGALGGRLKLGLLETVKRTVITKLINWRLSFGVLAVSPIKVTNTRQTIISNLTMS